MVVFFMILVLGAFIVAAYQTQRIASTRALAAVRKRKQQEYTLSCLRCNLHNVEHTLCGSRVELPTREAVQGVSATVYPQVYADIQALRSMFSLLEERVAQGRAQPAEFVVFQNRIDELCYEWREARENIDKQRQVLRCALRSLRERHHEIGKRYCLTMVDRIYQGYAGKLDLLEELLYDESFAVRPFIAYLFKCWEELNTCLDQYQQGIV